MSEHLKSIGMGLEYKTFLRPCEITGDIDFADFQKYGRIAEPGVYGPMPVTICRTCGFKMINPRYEDQFYKDYYEELYRAVAFGSTKPSPEYIEQQKQRGKGVLDYVMGYVTRPGRMLDLGCASGATMLAWIEAGWQCFGVDPHRPSVEAAVGGLGLNVKVGVGEDLPFEDAAFDLMLCLGPQEHAYDFNRMFAETRRTLVDGGYLLIRWRSDEIFGSPLEYYNHNHYRFFTPNTWALVLRKHGFSIMAATSEKLERWESYKYILARKDLEPSDEIVRNMIAGGVKDDWRRESEKLDALRHDYYRRCTAFLDLRTRCRGDVARIHAAVRRGEVRWKCMTDAAETEIRRAVMEAERYVVEYEEGRVR